jgi:hypothetical protein
MKFQPQAGIRNAASGAHVMVLETRTDGRTPNERLDDRSSSANHRKLVGRVVSSLVRIATFVLLRVLFWGLPSPFLSEASQ